MNRKILAGILAIGLVALAVGWGTYSQFSDTEASRTTFTAGTLDLEIGKDSTWYNGITLNFSYSNLRPGNQPHPIVKLRNIGSIDGYLDISSIVVVSEEDGLTEPEIEAGDTSADTGELDDVLGVTLFLDYPPVTGWYGAEDKKFFDGYVVGLPSTGFDLNELVPAGGGIDVVVEIYNWWKTPEDNQAQSDTLSITFTFKLSQFP